MSTAIYSTRTPPPLRALQFNFSGSAALKDLSQEREKHHFHDNLDRLWQSAASDCHFCALIKSTLPGPGEPGHTYESVRKEGRPLSLEIAPETATRRIPKGVLFDVGCSYSSGWSSIDVQDDSSTRLHPALAQAQTCSPDHADLAQTWIETCLSRHSSTCGYRNNRPFLPTRLLEFSGSEEDLSVQLYIPSAADIQLGLDYCTLSHCWGDTNVLCLTAATLQAFQQAIQWQRSPPHTPTPCASRGLLGCGACRSIRSASFKTR
ncbi:hypothetical protein B0H67DRAFT_558439 [Lasiosphaeris hirsuta]|uniref:Uncharacterized protein n=1 Tax=Lasiosphaeris hirsuta TaxID=260670 RepID=A0AA40DJA7_9PEZI|nr:hypothetical protein B0H67DRAFT_558439 [Lasiosphaeris hirsuta]